jgi:hypothetical protein
VYDKLVYIHLKHQENQMPTKLPPMSQRKATTIKRERRKNNQEVLESVIGKPKKTGNNHKLPQSTFRLDVETKRKLEVMREKLDANQVDVVVFAINQFYSLFEDKSTVDRIYAVIERKVQRKSKS